MSKKSVKSLIGARVLDVYEYVLFLDKRFKDGHDLIAIDLKSGKQVVLFLTNETYKNLGERIKCMHHAMQTLKDA